MPRLREASHPQMPPSEGHERAVTAQLEFLLDGQGRRLIEGRLAAKVVLECQRCLGPVELDICTEVNLAVVRDDEAGRDLPKSLDPWIVTDEQANLYEALEDELLLALPAVPLHDSDCIDAALLSCGDAPDVQTGEADTKENPFSVLAGLKQDLKNSD